MANGSDFLTFWNLVNRILASRGLPEMLYGEARGWFAENKWSRAA